MACGWWLDQEIDRYQLSLYDVILVPIAFNGVDLTLSRNIGISQVFPIIWPALNSHCGRLSLGSLVACPEWLWFSGVLRLLPPRSPSALPGVVHVVLMDLELPFCSAPLEQRPPMGVFPAVQDSTMFAQQPLAWLSLHRPWVVGSSSKLVGHLMALLVRPYFHHGSHSSLLTSQRLSLALVGMLIVCFFLSKQIQLLDLQGFNLPLQCLTKQRGTVSCHRCFFKPLGNRQFWINAFTPGDSNAGGYVASVGCI